MNDDHPFPLTASSFIVRKISVSTRVRLHSEFAKDPLRYAAEHDVNLVNAPSLEANFRYEPSKGQRVVTDKGNFHFLQDGALKVFVQKSEEEFLIRSITINPSLLLRSLTEDGLNPSDFDASSDIVLKQLTPLLADKSDKCHLLPGMSNGEQVAYWSRIVTEVKIPGLLIPCFHELAHPATGHSEGNTDTRLTLGDKADNCWIRLKKVADEKALCAHEVQEGGISVLVSLRRTYLPTAFSSFGEIAMVGSTERLVGITPQGVIQAHRKVISNLSGFYLPQPHEWVDATKRAINKRARITALASILMGVNVDEITAMYEEVNPVHETTQDRFKEQLADEMPRLNRIIVAELFSGLLYPTLTTQLSAPNHSDAM